MAVVAVRRPRDFPEMGTLLNYKPCGSSQLRRPQAAPAGWTMCECEADKDWILCDRVDAMAAEIADCIRQELCKDEKHSDAEDKVNMKEATLRFAEIQLEESNSEEQTEPKEMAPEGMARKDVAKREMTRDLLLHSLVLLLLCCCCCCCQKSGMESNPKGGPNRREGCRRLQRARKAATKSEGLTESCIFQSEPFSWHGFL
mmetsp:Transcript_12647/g.21709  ORF Transcript_12647/g.21709 Transcript_12647/m.21709 type:complete len:201 (+) Transcript_12647:49-651(+)